MTEDHTFRLEVKETTLIATIDDATSDIPGARFYPSETTWGCFKVLEDVITNHGVPEVILTDQAGCLAKEIEKLQKATFSQII